MISAQDNAQGTGTQYLYGAVQGPSSGPYTPAMLKRSGPVAMVGQGTGAQALEAPLVSPLPTWQ